MQNQHPEEAQRYAQQALSYYPVARIKTLADQIPASIGWQHTVKHDGTMLYLID